MAVAISKLLDLGAISFCQPSRDQFISRIFLTSKPNGDKRFILNLKPLNKFVTQSHFKMEDYRTSCRLIPKNGYMATIDMKESYLLVPVNPNQRKFLRFHFEDFNSQLITYEFKAMPYGLSAAPRAFTKIMREVITSLRRRGFKSVIYLDDIQCIGVDYEECATNVKETVNLLECLGFVINYDKSKLEPKQSCKFLGFIFNSTTMTLALPLEKKNHIAMLVKKFSTLPLCTIRDFAKLIGTLTAACPAVRYGWLYTKRLEREKYLALEKYFHYESEFTPSAYILDDLNWWAKNIFSTYNNLQVKDFDKEIFTDASRTGWGAYCKDGRTGGEWNESELGFHINYLELLAVFFGLKCFASNMRDSCILLRVDNTTALSYINRMGGTRFSHLNDLCRLIWQWCEERRLWLVASYINTKDNIEADEESRTVNIDTEWELSDKAYETIVATLGTPQIDLFASRNNAKCKIYVSWRQDPGAWKVDAFTFSWNPWYFYAFPPFSVILKCLQKIINDQAEGIVVFPYWPSQPWFPLLSTMAVSNIIYFHPDENLLHSTSRARHHLYNKLTLGVARLSGLHLQGKGHQPRF